ncbi:hypothetical protein GCM10023221_03070 [Luteimicrobium xylanilyticum]
MMGDVLGGQSVHRECNVVTITLSGIIYAIVVGLIIGALGRLFARGRQNVSILATILIGMVAAFLGTLIAGWLHVRHTEGIDWIQLIIQVALATLFVSLYAGRGGRRRARI